MNNEEVSKPVRELLTFATNRQAMEKEISAARQNTNNASILFFLSKRMIPGKQQEYIKQISPDLFENVQLRLES